MKVLALPRHVFFSYKNWKDYLNIKAARSSESNLVLDYYPHKEVDQSPELIQPLLFTVFALFDPVRLYTFPSPFGGTSCGVPIHILAPECTSCLEHPAKFQLCGDDDVLCLKGAVLRFPEAYYYPLCKYQNLLPVKCITLKRHDIHIREYDFFWGSEFPNHVVYARWFDMTKVDCSSVRGKFLPTIELLQIPDLDPISALVVRSLLRL